MKKLKLFVAFAVALCCFSMLAGCLFFDGFVLVNNWRLTPQQATGTEVNLAFVSGSEMEFAFTVKNLGEARQLNANNFDVVCVVNNTEQNSISVYFDSHQASISFEQNQSKNITLHALTSSSFSNSSKVIIRYDGTIICEYLVR